MIVIFRSKCSRSHGLASLASYNSTNTWIIAWGLASNRNCCKKFHFEEKVEKHWK